MFQLFQVQLVIVASLRRFRMVYLRSFPWTTVFLTPYGPSSSMKAPKRKKTYTWHILTQYSHIARQTWHLTSFREKYFASITISQGCVRARSWNHLQLYRIQMKLSLGIQSPNVRGWLGCTITSETHRSFRFHETILSFGEPGLVGSDKCGDVHLKSGSCLYAYKTNSLHTS